MRVLAVANPFCSTGGCYRVYKSLAGYPLKGVETYLFLTHRRLRDLSTATLRELAVKGVRFLGYSRARVERLSVLSTVLHMLPLSVEFKVLRPVPNFDVVMSFHENLEELYTTWRLAEKYEATSLAIIQNPLSLAEARRKALFRAIRLWYKALYGSRSEWRSIRAELSYRVREKISLFIAKRLDVVVGITRATCEEMRGHSLGMFCIDRGVTFDEEELRLIEGVRSSVEHKKNIITYTGGLNPAKGVLEAILAFRIIAGRHDGTKLYVTGSAPPDVEQALKGFVEKLGLKGRVVFTGRLPREELLKVVGASKLLLHPSHMDAFSYAVAEALLLGTPVVAYNIPAMRIHFGGLEGVRLVEEGDVESMATEALDVLSKSSVKVDRPELRKWEEILEEEVALLHAIAGKA